MPTQEYLARKRKYIQSYNKKNYRSMNLTFRVDDPDDMAIYEFLRSRYSTVQFVKDLAKAAMEKEKSEGRYWPSPFFIFVKF